MLVRSQFSPFDKDKSQLDTAKNCILRAVVNAPINFAQRRICCSTYYTTTQLRRTTWFCIAFTSAIMAHQASYAAGIVRDLPGSIDVFARPADPRLPVGAPIRVTIRYSSENSAAQHRAAELARGLRGQGLNVIDPVASPERIANNTVSYFYVEDRPGAEIAARALGSAWRSVQQRLSPRESLARPGTIELAVAGP